MERLKPVDAVIVGGGWTGLLLAKEITSRTSLSVVVLERSGQAARPAEYATKMDELDYNIRLRMMQNIADETVTHRHSRKDAAAPVRQYGSFHPGTGVGGAGGHWGGRIQPVPSRAVHSGFPFASEIRFRKVTREYCGSGLGSYLR
jgi:gluconate 2-dehydrogenase alpha chain